MKIEKIAPGIQNAYKSIKSAQIGQFDEIKISAELSQVTVLEDDVPIDR
jgi:hypothetical protein